MPKSIRISLALLLMFTLSSCASPRLTGEEVVVRWVQALTEGDSRAASGLTYGGITTAEMKIERELITGSAATTAVIGVHVRRISEDIYTVDEVVLRGETVVIYESGDPYEVVVPPERNEVWARLGKDGVDTKTFAGGVAQP